MAAQVAPARENPLFKAISLLPQPCELLFNDHRPLPLPRLRIRPPFAQLVRQSRGAVLLTAHPATHLYLLHILRPAILLSQCLLDRRVTRMPSDRTGARP